MGVCRRGARVKRETNTMGNFFVRRGRDVLHQVLSSQGTPLRSRENGTIIRMHLNGTKEVIAVEADILLVFHILY